MKKNMTDQIRIVFISEPDTLDTSAKTSSFQITAYPQKRPLTYKKRRFYRTSLSNIGTTIAL